MRQISDSRAFRMRGTRGSSLALESLESRIVLSATSTHIHAAIAIIGTISGDVTNDVTGGGVKNEKIALYNSNGSVVAIARTNATGYYQFGITQNGPYVVREFTPKGYQQTSPTFVNVPLTPDPNALSSFQSPINITGKPVNLATVLKIGYAPANSSGAYSPVGAETAAKDEVAFTPSNADTVTVGGTIYQLAQLHMHSPSETLVNGRTTNLEIHMVNISNAGGISVLTSYVKLGAHNYALDPILDAMQKVTNTPSAPLSVQGPINLAGLLPRNMQGWYYVGGLTSSPYSGPLNFFVFQQPITLSLAQFETYVAFSESRGTYPNNRPVQPLNGRLLNMINNQVNFVASENSAVTEDFSIAPRS